MVNEYATASLGFDPARGFSLPAAISLRASPRAFTRLPSSRSTRAWRPLRSGSAGCGSTWARARLGREAHVLGLTAGRCGGQRLREERVEGGKFASHGKAGPAHSGSAARRGRWLGRVQVREPGLRRENQRRHSRWLTVPKDAGAAGRAGQAMGPARTSRAERALHWDRGSARVQAHVPECLTKRRGTTRTTLRTRRGRG